MVALSSAEAEFRGMAKWVCELLWLKRLVEEVMCSAQDTMDLFCDECELIAPKTIGARAIHMCDEDQAFFNCQIRILCLCYVLT